jgi:flagellar biosynthesis protein FlhG
MAYIIPVAGGKGGVGKSIYSLNIAVTLAKQCKKVILVDLDLGGSNLHTLLGLKNNQAGLGTFIARQEEDFSNLLQATGIPGLQFIAGDCLFPGTANMDFFTKKKILTNLEKLNADYIILDLGAGSSYNVIDFFLTSYKGTLVVTPELTSILNAYSFLKSTVFRFLYRQFPAKSPERQVLQNSILKRMEGKEYSFAQIMEVMCKTFPETANRAKNEMKKLKPRVIMNMGRSNSDIEMGNRLYNLAKKKLAIEIEYIGFIPYDERVPISVAKRTPISILAPNSQYNSVMDSIARRIISTSGTESIFLQDVTESLENLVKDYYKNKTT